MDRRTCKEITRKLSAEIINLNQRVINEKLLKGCL